MVYFIKKDDTSLIDFIYGLEPMYIFRGKIIGEQITIIDGLQKKIIIIEGDKSLSLKIKKERVSGRFNENDCYNFMSSYMGGKRVHFVEEKDVASNKSTLNLIKKEYYKKYFVNMVLDFLNANHGMEQKEPLKKLPKIWKYGYLYSYRMPPRGFHW